ncbi:hypothetical protein GPECTOR_4g675 [Gonium pectorale]|uniref:Bromo domain-containing protein n=1 Tax=Gonium pectorale TaxID=33097 RepID=A0A150GZ49_GONPE|nr:hypothetical protein GPECTOR_4g675 [Gonium pectorale]|eukprot:KXZ54610.1 hypothetical protein GPECTOR_4g675 [Gonium pectorale]
MPAAAKSGLSHRIKFRLDDGSVIADSSLLGVDGNGVVRVPVDKATVERNLASEKELERLQRLLSNPELPQLPQLNGFEGPPSKKPRLESRPSVSMGVIDWTIKCRELIQSMIKGLRGDAQWFMNRVEEKVAPDYYTIIKNPMWINRVIQKLDAAEYTSPQDFCDDVRLIWSNCCLYNPVGNPVRLIAEKAEKRFETDWANSGLGVDRGRRATAGVAAPKYDPDFEPPPPKTTPRERAPTRSAGNPAPKKPAPPVPAAAPSRAANGGRAYSHEVTSGGKGREKALSSERRNQIATELQNALGELSEEQLNELMGLLPQEAMQPDESGEMELDFEALDDANLRKLEAWLRSVRGQAPVSPSHISHNPSVRLEAGDQEEEDYQSD